MAKKKDKKINSCPMDSRYSDCVAKLFSAGKTVDEICGAFPEYEDQIREFCASLLANEPARPPGGQTGVKPRPDNAGPRKSLGSPNFGLFDPLSALISKRKAMMITIALLSVVVVANAAWLAANSGSKPAQAADQGLPADSLPPQNIIATEGDKNTAVVPEPTGKIEDTVVAINNFLGLEDGVISAEGDDVKLIAFDNAAIDNFGTIIPENLGNLATCDSIKTLISQVARNITDRTSSLAVAQAGRLNKLIAGQNSRDNHLEAQRSVADSQLRRDYDKMGLIAEGGAQKQGVADFRLAVTAAIAVRRTAIDEAQSNFRAALNQLLQQRMVNVKSAADALAAAVNLSLGQSFQSCQNQGNAQAVIQAQNGINTARQIFSNAKSQIESQNGEALAGARAQAIKNANDNFAAALQRAVQNLKMLQF